MRIEYRLSAPGAPTWSFVMHLNAENHLVREGRDDGAWPAWTSLGELKCPHCSLDTQLDRFCPAATSIVPLVEAFGDSLSYEEADVEVITADRTLRTHASLQSTLSSLMGFCLATSGCPTMDFFKPMARFHLPFASEEETQYRVMSMYLLGQFFIQRRGGVPDWNLERLPARYEEVHTVNVQIAKRLSEAAKKDANANALVHLDCFAASISFLLRKELYDNLDVLFDGYS